MLSIRRMKRSDIDTVVTMDERNFISPLTPGILESELNREIGYYIVLEKNSEIIGYAGMWEVLGEAHITHVCIDKPYQGEGYGNELMNHLINRCIKRHFFGIILEVRDHNVPAISLYEKYKFKTIGVRKNYYTESNEDALIMWRDILEGEDLYDSACD